MMRVCDRHPRKQATDTIKIESTDSEFDLCKQCAEEITKFISNPRKESVEKKPLWDRIKSA